MALDFRWDSFEVAPMYLSELEINKHHFNGHLA